MAPISNGVSGLASPISGVPRTPSSIRARNSSRGRFRAMWSRGSAGFSASGIVADVTRVAELPVDGAGFTFVLVAVPVTQEARGHERGSGGERIQHLGEPSPLAGFEQHPKLSDASDEALRIVKRHRNGGRVAAARDGQGGQRGRNAVSQSASQGRTGDDLAVLPGVGPHHQQLGGAEQPRPELHRSGRGGGCRRGQDAEEPACDGATGARSSAPSACSHRRSTPPWIRRRASCSRCPSARC